MTKLCISLYLNWVEQSLNSKKSPIPGISPAANNITIRKSFSASCGQESSYHCYEFDLGFSGHAQQMRISAFSGLKTVVEFSLFLLER